MQAQKFKTGDIADLVESNRFIRKGRVETCGGGLVLYHFIEDGAIRVKEHRLFLRKIGFLADGETPLKVERD